MADVGNPRKTYLLGIAFFKNESAEPTLQWMIFEPRLEKWTAGAELTDIPNNFKNLLVNNRTYRVVKIRGKLCFVPVGQGQNIFIFNMSTYRWSCAQASSALTGTIGFDLHRDLFMVGGKVDAEHITGGIFMIGREDRQGPEYRYARKCASMNVERHSVGVGILGNSLYVVGGSRRIRGEELDTVERFRPGYSTTVHVCKSLSTKRRHPAIGNLDGHLYCVGGLANNTWTDTAERYDPDTDTWTDIAPMLYDFRGSNTSVISFDGELLVAGTHGEKTKIIAYHPGENCWRHVPASPEPRTTNFQMIVLNETDYQVLSHILTKNTCEIKEWTHVDDFPEKSEILDALPNFSLIQSIYLELEKRKIIHCLHR